MIEYGSFVYYQDKENFFTKLEKVQNIAIRSALGYRISTPRIILIAESKIVTIKERIKYLCKCFLSKISSTSGSLTLNNINKYYNTVKKKPNYKPKNIIFSCFESFVDANVRIIKTDKAVIFCHDYNTIYTSIPINIKYGNLLKHSRIPNTLFSDIFSDMDGLKIFTDGSKSTESPHVGSACLCSELEICIQQTIDKNASVFTAESIALRDALDIALCNKNRNILIFSDSLSVLQSLQFPHVSLKTKKCIIEIKEKFNQFYTNNTNNTTITFFWIPSHVGITENENVDKLAKEAADSLVTDITTVPFTDLHEKYKKQMFQNNHEYLTRPDHGTGTIYFQSYYKNERKPWYFNRKLDRDFIVTVNRMRSNHYHLAASLARIGIIENAKCKCDEYDENLNHIIFQCELYKNKRSKLIENLHKMNLFLPLNIESLITKPNIKACRYITNFLKDCNLKI